MTKSGNFETTYLPHLCKRSLWMSLTGIANETPLFRHFIVILPLWSEKSRLAYQKLRCSVVTVYCINFKSTGRFRQSCLAFFQNLNFISLLHCFWDFSLCRLTKRMKIRSITRIFLENSWICTIDSICTLVTQPMIQRQPNATELRLMDSYIQILCWFQMFYMLVTLYWFAQ